MEQLGRVLVIAGLGAVLVGALFIISPKLPWLGRLPGDIVMQKKNFTFYFPLATSILISILLTLLFWLFGKK